MSESSEEIQILQNPNLLKQYFLRLIEGTTIGLDVSDLKEKEIQLREICKTIENLERVNVAVPDAFRNEKSRLVSSISDRTKTKEYLISLASAMEEIVREIKSHVGHTPANTTTRTVRTRSDSPKTSRYILRDNIILALKQLGGSANSNDVIRQMENQLQGNLTPGDMVLREGVNQYAWENNARWEHSKMKQEGILKNDRPFGIWELSDEYK